MNESQDNETQEIQIQDSSNRAGIWRNLAIGFGIAFLVILIFQAGMFVGMEKARFSYRWSENYNRNFGGTRMGPFGQGGFFGGHGAVGPIIRINKNNIVIRDRETVEKVISITKDTHIISGRDEISKKDLKVDDQLVVIGAPGKNGNIDAKLIRVFNSNDLPRPGRDLPPAEHGSPPPPPSPSL